MKLPPLNAVRAFEVAARLRSIKDAADELNVTPGAVSRQVKILEEFLDIPLFRRNHREIVLTPTGLAYQASLTRHLSAIEEATNDIVEQDADRPLHVWCSITFSLSWLMPRLHKFQNENGNSGISDVSFTTSLHPHDLLANKIDIAIRAFGVPGNEVITEPLFETDIIPVCSPGYLENTIANAESDFDQFTYLHSRIRDRDWADWFKLQGISEPDNGKHIHYSFSSLAYEAATLGHGISLAMKACVDKELDNGDLVQPFETKIENGAKFFLTYSAERRKKRRVAEFRDWIISEAESSK